jgi:O-succinylbenzoate synthase
VVLQADANGSFREDDEELDRLDAVGLACLEQPLAPADLLGHARLAERLATPICLDEPLTSLDAVEAAVALGACEVVCLKPARVGGWIAARAVHDRCAELGVPLWVGGMLETGVGRAANLAVAALPHVALPPDLDPRGRYQPDLADPCLPVDGAVRVPSTPGTGAVPDLSARDGVQVMTGWSR